MSEECLAAKPNFYLGRTFLFQFFSKFVNGFQKLVVLNPRLDKIMTSLLEKLFVIAILSVISMHITIIFPISFPNALLMSYTKM